MSGVDKRNRLDAQPFTYQARKDGRVVITWNARPVKTLSGVAAQKFLHKIDSLEGKDAQLLMAKATGNFKRGNER
jgi:hypothetical protein